MIRIKGGPGSTTVRVYNISDDGIETELTGITKIEFNELNPGEILRAKISFMDVEFDVIAEQEQNDLVE